MSAGMQDNSKTHKLCDDDPIQIHPVVFRLAGDELHKAGSKKPNCQVNTVSVHSGGLKIRRYECPEAKRPLRIIVTAEQTRGIKQAPTLFEGQSALAVLADKVHDNNAVLARVPNIGATVAIAFNGSRKFAITHNAARCKHRNRIERCFSSLKHWRCFASRYDRGTVILKASSIKPLPCMGLLIVGPV
jgi:transposase